jgi:4-amino-4-deoxy-L-arabinose transferase-like glycosyltransferase
MRGFGLTWGLPASDGWDSDGIAPRDFLVGVVKTYQPGEFFPYPPLQLLLLTLVTFPGWIVGLFKTGSFAPPDVIAELIKVPYMTFFAIVARVVSAAMSVGTIAWVGKIGEELGGRRVGACAAAACALNATLVYYGNVTNLDGPCLFWSTLAAWQWMRAIARHEPRRFRWASLFTVAAIATKDQAYAVFLLSLPMVFAMWLAVDPWPRRNWRLVTGHLCIAIAIASIALLAVDGAITNPHGFGERVLYLLGPASQDHAFYPHDWGGRFQVLVDAFANFQHAYPGIAAYLGLFGLCVHAWRGREDRSVWAAGFFPLFAIVSFTLTFNFVALRSEDRFVLAQTVFFSVYLGMAVDVLVFRTYPAFKWVARVAIVALAGFAFVRCGPPVFSPCLQSYRSR